MMLRGTATIVSVAAAFCVLGCGGGSSVSTTTVTEQSPYAEVASK